MKHLPSHITQYCVTPSPAGKLLLAGDADGLKLVSFQDGTHPVSPDPSWVYDEAPFVDAIEQIEAYFAGELRTFTIKLKPEGTPFQKRCAWPMESFDDYCARTKTLPRKLTPNPHHPAVQAP